MSLRRAAPGRQTRAPADEAGGLRDDRRLIFDPRKGRLLLRLRLPASGAAELSAVHALAGRRRLADRLPSAAGDGEDEDEGRVWLRVRSCVACLPTASASCCDSGREGQRGPSCLLAARCAPFACARATWSARGLCSVASLPKKKGGASGERLEFSLEPEKEGSDERTANGSATQPESRRGCAGVRFSQLPVYSPAPMQAPSSFVSCCSN